MSRASSALFCLVNTASHIRDGAPQRSISWASGAPLGSTDFLPQQQQHAQLPAIAWHAATPSMQLQSAMQQHVS